MEKTAKNNKVKRVCITGLMAALICVATAFIKMPTGINSGYLHFGDSMIYLAGCLLGPWASLAAAIGGALADVISGAPQWAPATAVIKALNAVPFIRLQKHKSQNHHQMDSANDHSFGSYHNWRIPLGRGRYVLVPNSNHIGSVLLHSGSRLGNRIHYRWCSP